MTWQRSGGLVGVSLLHLLFAQMGAPLGDADYYLASCLLPAVAGGDGAMVELHERTAEMEPDSRAGGGVGDVIAYPIESFENLFKLVGVDSDARVGHRKLHISVEGYSPSLSLPLCRLTLISPLGACI